MNRWTEMFFKLRHCISFLPYRNWLQSHVMTIIFADASLVSLANPNPAFVSPPPHFTPSTLPSPTIASLASMDLEMNQRSRSGDNPGDHSDTDLELNHRTNYHAKKNMSDFLTPGQFYLFISNELAFLELI
jgi:hypothetical protein